MENGDGGVQLRQVYVIDPDNPIEERWETVQKKNSKNFGLCI
jgi:peroxiredoxin